MKITFTVIEKLSRNFNHCAELSFSDIVVTIINGIQNIFSQISRFDVLQNVY